MTGFMMVTVRVCEYLKTEPLIGESFYREIILLVCWFLVLWPWKKSPINRPLSSSSLPSQAVTLPRPVYFLVFPTDSSHSVIDKLFGMVALDQSRLEVERAVGRNWQASGGLELRKYRHTV